MKACPMIHIGEKQADAVFSKFVFNGGKDNITVIVVEIGGKTES